MSVYCPHCGRATKATGGRPLSGCYDAISGKRFGAEKNILMDACPRCGSHQAPVAAETTVRSKNQSSLEARKIGKLSFHHNGSREFTVYVDGCRVGRLRYHLKPIVDGHDGGRQLDWQVVVQTVADMVQCGVPPSTTDIRSRSRWRTTNSSSRRSSNDAVWSLLGVK